MSFATWRDVCVSAMESDEPVAHESGIRGDYINVTYVLFKARRSGATAYILLEPLQLRFTPFTGTVDSVALATY